MEKKSEKIAWITGTSNGLGKAVAEKLLDIGMIVHGVSRGEADIFNDNYHHHQADVSDYTQMTYVHRKIVAEHGEVDFLINNAGTGMYGPVAEADVLLWKQMFDVNVHGVFYTAKCVIAGMQERGSGHIVNISSVAGQNGVANLAGYVGTKHAVRGISHSLFFELREHGIKVSCVYPGSVDTGFFDNEMMKNMKTSPHKMAPEDVADTIVHLLNSPNNYNVVDVEMRPLQPKG